VAQAIADGIVKPTSITAPAIQRRRAEPPRRTRVRKGAAPQECRRRREQKPLRSWHTYSHIGTHSQRAASMAAQRRHVAVTIATEVSVPGRTLTL
jgi:hypothetical protein